MLSVVPQAGKRISIPVCELEFVVDGNTIWIHSPRGATVLRIKTTGTILVDVCDSNPVSHFDINVEGDIKICLADDVVG